MVSSERSENILTSNLISDKEFTVRHVIDEQGLEDAIGVDLVIMTTSNEGKDSIYKIFPMNVVGREGNLYTFELTTSVELAGSFKMAYRMYPKNKHLVNRQDFSYVRWFI